MRFRLLLVFGLALYWPFFRNAYFWPLLSPQGGAPIALGALYVTLGVVGWVASRCPSATRELLRRPEPLLICSGCATLLLYGLPFAGSVLPYELGAAIATALCAAALIIGWTVACTDRECPRHHLTFDAAASFLLSYVVTGPVMALPMLEGIVLPAFPLLSAVALAVASEHAPAPPQAVAEGSKPRPLVKQTAVLVILASVLVGLHTMGVVNYSDSHSDNRYWTSLAVGVLFLLCVVIAERRPGAQAAVWGVVLVLLFAGVLSTLALGEAWHEAGADVIVIGRLLLWILYWVLLVESAQDGRGDAVVLVGLFFLVLRSLSLILTDAISAAIEALSLGNSFIDIATLVAATGFLAIAFLFIGLHGAAGRGAETTASPAPPSAPDTQVARETACRDLARTCGLTEREANVLVLLSQGHTMKKVGDKLFISLDTTKTHARSLYRKLGVHSKQELIDLVNGRIGS